MKFRLCYLLYVRLQGAVEGSCLYVFRHQPLPPQHQKSETLLNQSQVRVRSFYIIQEANVINY